MQGAFATSAAATDLSFEKATLYRCIDQAKRLKLITLSIAETAKFMIRFIPNDAHAPISPVRVNRIASELGIDVRTVHRHTQRLIQLGIVSNRSLDGGHRICYRSTRGITDLFGIDFSPLLDHVDRLQSANDQADAEEQSKIQLRARISVMRRSIRAYVEQIADPDHPFSLRFAAFPPRIGQLALDALEDLSEAVKQLFDDVTDASFADKESDKSDISALPITNSKNSYVISNRKPMKKAEKQSVRAADEGISVEPIENDDLEAFKTILTPALLYAIAPEEWQTDLQSLSASPGWTEFELIAQTRSAALGVWPNKFAELNTQLGLKTLTFLAIMIDHHGPSGTGKIKKPVGWILEMTRRIDAGTANLTRSLFGLMEELNVK